MLRLCMAICTNMRPVSINSLLSHACILSDDVIQALVLAVHEHMSYPVFVETRKA